MPKVIVTHKNPDLDAIMSAWLLIRFDQSRYGDAAFEFVPGGTTYKNLPVDEDQGVVHVDVGYGKYDHHQAGSYGTCASKLVWEALIKEGLIAPTDMALRQMVEYALAIDLFVDCEWAEAGQARYAFTLSEIVPALHRLQIHDNEAVLRMVLIQLDGVYQRLKDMYKAKEEIAQGIEFASPWGKGLAVESGSDDVHKTAQKMGYKIVVEKTNKGYVKIKIVPGLNKTLKDLYDKIVAVDGVEKWFYHNSGQMMLNGSSKGPSVEPSSLTISEILTMINRMGGVK